ncbi:hypothetical protein E3A20_29240 [Planctomyces bekefii]|uniref:Cytochrome c domain-containing protein n=1 Tax=Planctomyces bekefii TaxID=1653850 RepID=A0A5C6M0U9_9PLAN|nr:hypothetical protein E3A20_29240 [Planctomyces bekefii]
MRQCFLPLLLVLQLVLASGCNSAAPQPDVVAACGSPTEKKQSLDLADSVDMITQGNGGASAPPVTFYGDLLPVLSSNESGAVYKCVTCHAHYGKPEGLSSVLEIERIVTSLKNGRMPRGGDPVPADKIELFSVWRLQGFQSGSPKKQESVTGQSSDANPQVGEVGGCK